LADANTYRYSSKDYDRNSGTYYYGFRFYEPNFQRWLNRDPIQEAGGINLYQFAGNSSINYVDPFGLYWSLFGLGFGQTATYMNPNGTVGYGTPPSAQAPSNPENYGAMRAAMIGDPNDNNFNGLTGAQVAQQMGQAAAEATIGMMVPGGAGDEGAYQAADEALQAARAARAAAKCEKASEKAAKAMARQIAKDLGKDAQRAFHDAKEPGSGDRTMEQLKADAQALYEEYGVPIPKWMQSP
jgi:RHS repeat-associated protein